MKSKLLITALLSFSFYLLSSQTPQGFNYQAIARDGTTPVTDPIDIRITIQSLAVGGTIFWQELHSKVQPNESGLFKLVVGQGEYIDGLKNFSDIDWKIAPKYIMTEIYYKDWLTMGAAELLSVPYSMVAKDLEGPINKLGIDGTTTNVEEALFEVKNIDGQTVFAVYNEGVRVYVSDGDSKGTKGGFAIGGFGVAKGDIQKYFVVKPDSVRIYIDDRPGKASKGGFAIGGFGYEKGQTDDYMRVDPDVLKAGKVEFLNITPLNTFIGESAGANTIPAVIGDYGKYNTFIGYEAGLGNIGGHSNIFMGFNSGYTNSTGNDNIFIGNNAGKKTNGYSNVFIGQNSGTNAENVDYNIYLGELSGYNNKDGSSNIFIGYEAGVSSTAGSDNTYIGPFSAHAISGGNANIIMGMEAANSKTSGSENVLLGSWVNETGLSGSKNVMVGTYAGAASSGDQNMLIGYGAGSGITSGSNNIAIGYSAQVPTATASNQIRLGNTSVDYAGIQVAWTVTSDIRWKESIEDLYFGLDFVNQLHPVDYIRKNNETQTREAGFIAQDVEKVLDEMGGDNYGILSKGAEGSLELRYNDFIPILTKAIQEQQHQIESLTEDNNALRSENKNFRSEIEDMQQQLEKIEKLLAKNRVKKARFFR